MHLTQSALRDAIRLLDGAERRAATSPARDDGSSKNAARGAADFTNRIAQLILRGRVDEYRTLCVAPPPEVLRAFEAARAATGPEPSRRSRVRAAHEGLGAAAPSGSPAAQRPPRHGLQSMMISVQSVEALKSMTKR